MILTKAPDAPPEEQTAEGADHLRPLVVVGLQLLQVLQGDLPG